MPTEQPNEKSNWLRPHKTARFEESWPAKPASPLAAALLLSMIVLAGLALEVDRLGIVYLEAWPRARFPVVCPSRHFLGVPCPLCGLTRSLIHLLHARPAESYSCHRLGAPLLVVIILQIPLRLSRRSWGGTRIVKWLSGGLVFNALAAAIVVNWIWNVLTRPEYGFAK